MRIEGKQLGGGVPLIAETVDRLLKAAEDEDMWVRFAARDALVACTSSGKIDAEAMSMVISSF